MKDLYYILRVNSDITQNELESAYKRRLIYSDIGNSDYENIWDSEDVKLAYKILSNKAYRFLYDIKSGNTNRYPVSFNNKLETGTFLDIIENKLLCLNEQNKNHIHQISHLKKTISQLMFKVKELEFKYEYDTKELAKFNELKKINSVYKDEVEKLTSRIVKLLNVEHDNQTITSNYKSQLENLYTSYEQLIGNHAKTINELESQLSNSIQENENLKVTIHNNKVKYENKLIKAIIATILVCVSLSLLIFTV